MTYLLRVSITFPFHLSPPPLPPCHLSFLMRYTFRLALSADNAYRHKAATTHHKAAVLHPLFLLTYLLLQCLPFVRLLHPYSISITSAGARTEVAFYYTKTRPADKFSSMYVFKTALLIEEGRQLSVSQSGFPSIVSCLPCSCCLASLLCISTRTTLRQPRAAVPPCVPFSGQAPTFSIHSIIC